jgi:hypothetical protein
MGMFVCILPTRPPTHTRTTPHNFGFFFFRPLSLSRLTPPFFFPFCRRDTLNTTLSYHGTHVIQRFLKRFAPSQCDFLHEMVRKHTAELMLHINGVGVVLLCMDSSDKQTRAKILSFLFRHAVSLSTHPMGNYVGCHILSRRHHSLRIGALPGLAEEVCNALLPGPPPADGEGLDLEQHGGPPVRKAAPGEVREPHPLFDEDVETIRKMWLSTALCRCFRGHIAELARGKYSSNVIEKCVTWGGTERVNILEELVVKSDLREYL